MKQERYSRHLISVAKTVAVLSFIFSFPVAGSSQNYEQRYAGCSKQYGITVTAPDSVIFKNLLSMHECLIGAMAPNFKATTINGKAIELAKLKGSVVVINFWALWCGPCVKELPWLNKLTKLYPGKKINFISLAVDNSGDVKEFLKHRPFNYATIANSEKIMEDIFKLPGMFPYTVIIDKEGKIFEWRVGGFDDEKQAISFYKKIIDRAL